MDGRASLKGPVTVLTGKDDRWKQWRQKSMHLRSACYEILTGGFYVWRKGEEKNGETLPCFRLGGWWSLTER